MLILEILAILSRSKVTPDRGRSAATVSFLGFNAFQSFQKISLFGLKLPSFVIFPSAIVGVSP